MSRIHRYEATLNWTGAAKGPAENYAGYSRDYEVTIPRNAFKRYKPTVYTFRTTINRVEVWGRITKVSPTQFRVDVTAEGPHRAGTANQMSVSVNIGDDRAVALVTPQPL